MNKDRKEYLKKYRLTHKEQYRKYSEKYRKNNLTTYNKLKRENEKLQNNWNELKKWLQERKFVYNITGEDLDEDTSITEVLVKMCEIESGSNE